MSKKLHSLEENKLTSFRLKIITGSRDRTIRVWDMRTYSCSLVIGPPEVVNNPAIMTGEDGNPQHYATMDDASRKAVSFPKLVSFDIHHKQSILCLQYDKDILVTGSSDGSCIVYDINRGYEPIRRLEHHRAAVLDLAFDERYIVTCSKDVSICVWDRETGVMLKQLQGHSGPVNAVQMRGNTIVSCSGDFRVKLWNIDTGKNIREFSGHTKGLACSQFSDDSRFIASAGNDKIIRIWDANTGECLKKINAHENLVRSLHIDSVSGRLISGSYDQDLKVFEMKTGRLLLDFPKWHSSWVLGAKSDYRRIISTGQDPKILIMDFGMKIKGIELLESGEGGV
jgi:F-box and WD-40 domain protein 1/11